MSRKLRKYLATITILTFILNSCGQPQPFQFDKRKISGRIKTIVARIEKENTVKGSAVGYSGTKPKQYDNFVELRAGATKTELIELTNHPNGAVRCYSFWALTHDSTANLLPLLIKHISDDEQVSTLFGCMGGVEKVGDFFIDLTARQYFGVNSNKLTPLEYEYLDSILIHTPNNLYAKDVAIRSAKLNETNYKRIRELVLKEGNQSAVVTLAKFKRKEDIPIILNNRDTSDREDLLFFQEIGFSPMVNNRDTSDHTELLSSTFRAISEFPDSAFLPLLKRSLFNVIKEEKYHSNVWGELYRAIASFKNDTALQLLKVPFTQAKHVNIKKYHIDYIFDAVEHFYTPIYNELLWTMWENEKRISMKAFKSLYAENPDKAFQLTKKTVQNPGRFYHLTSVNYGVSQETPLTLLEVMIDTIMVRDRVFAIQLINKNLREIDVHKFPTFAEKALQVKDTSFVTSLFDRLEKESNPHIYLRATKTLIALSDKEINKRIIEVSKRNPNLKTDWGGKEFMELLKENNIE